MASKVKKWKKTLANYIFRSDIDHIKRRIDSILQTRMHNNTEISNACVKATTKLHGDLKEYGFSDIKINKIVADHINHYEIFRKDTVRCCENLEVLYKNSANMCSYEHKLPVFKFIKNIEHTLATYHKYIDSIVEASEESRNKLFS
jgi:hypothetical protein